MMIKQNSAFRKLYLLPVCILIYFFLNNAVLAIEAIDSINNNNKAVENFTGRINLIARLSDIINHKNNIFIHGEAGIGKTQLIRKVVEKIKHKYHVVWWINLEHDEEWQYRSLINKMGIDISSQHAGELENINFKNVVNFLNKSKYKVLLIFDNLTEGGKISDIVNKSEALSNIQKIFISQKKFDLNESIEVNHFNTIESVGYLNKYLSKKGSKKDMQKISSMLGGHPLFLEQAIVYILQSKRLRVDDYIKILEEESLQILSDSRKIDRMKNNYMASPYNVIKLAILAVQKENKDSYKLLREVSFLSSEFSEKLLIELYKSGNKKFSLVEFNKAADNILEYNLMNHHDKVYTAHEIKSKVINKEFGSRKDLQNVVSTILNLLPKEIGRLVLFLEDNPLLLDNMISVFKHILDNKVINEESIIFKIKLLNSYMVQYKYDKALFVINSLEEDINQISELSIQNIRKEIICFRVLQSRYKRIKKFDDPSAISHLKQAKALLNSNDPADLQFFVLAQEALTYSELGDIAKSKSLTNKIDQDLHQYINQSDMPMKPFYLRIKRDFYIEEGKYHDAINNIIDSIKSYDTKSEKRKLYEYIPLADLFIEVGKLPEALEYIAKCESIINNKSDLLDNNKNNLALHILKANYFIATDDITKAAEEISLAQKVSQDVVYSFSERQANKYMVEIHRVNGNLLARKGEYLHAINQYIEAESLLLKLYNNKLEKRVYSNIYEKIVENALKIDDNQLAKKYYNIQRDNFGDKNDVTERIRKKINILDLEIL